MSFTADFKLVFLDDPKFLKQVEKAKRKNLIAQGALVRTIARRSMRSRKKASEPGSPPSAHKGSLKRLLTFSWEDSEKTVVIGPAWFSGSKTPDTLEHGGMGMVMVRRKKVEGRNYSEREVAAIRRKAGPRKKIPVKIKARPYMKPAGDKAQDRYPDIWRDSIVG